jgi:succinoglycan biosynthesis protein ExoU
MPGARTDAATVDVVIAAWNRSSTIERAVSSALDEPEVAKVIVVDDGSTDDTAQRAERAGSQGGRVIVHSMRNNRGPAAARNEALALSSAPWIAILDGDDYFLPGRVGKLLALAGESDFVGDNILQIDDARIGELKPSPAFGDWPEPRPLNFERFVLGNIGRSGARRRELGFMKPLIRRSFLERHALRYEEELRLGEDFALYARSLAFGARFIVAPACGYVAVLRPDSLSGVHSKQDLERFRDFDLRLAAHVALAPAEQRALAAHCSSVDARIRWLAVIEAFKSRNLARFLSSFVCAPAVSGFLLRQLLAEGVRRFPVPLRR